MNKELKDNPHYQNGVYWGNKIADNIEKSRYTCIRHALESKEDFGRVLKKDLDMADDHPDYLENLGIIDVLKERV